MQRKIPSGLADLPHFLRGNVSLTRWNYTPVPDRVQQRQRHQGQLSDEPQFPLRATLVAVFKNRTAGTHIARRDTPAHQSAAATPARPPPEQKLQHYPSRAPARTTPI